MEGTFVLSTAQTQQLIMRKSAGERTYRIHLHVTRGGDSIEIQTDVASELSQGSSQDHESVNGAILVRLAGSTQFAQGSYELIVS
jgi:hypothetical protein